VQLRELTEAELGAVQAMIERCRDHYLLASGAGPKPTAARDVWDRLPDDMPRSAKLTLGVFEDGLVGIADVVRGWPRAETWLIGLLLLNPAARGRGVGAHVVGHIDAEAAGAGAERLHVAVLRANVRGLAFWRRLGFADVPTSPTSAIVLEREVVR